EREVLTKTKRMTYKEVYDLWLPLYKNSVEESTYVKTEGIFRNHILPSLGGYFIDKIDVNMCQEALYAWFNRLQKFNMVKSYAARVFDFALKRGIIQTNPFNRVEPLRRKKELSFNDDEDDDVNFYSRDELNTFLAHAKKGSDKKAYTMFRLLAYTGIRKGEALALRWSDIDFHNKTILINKALGRGINNRLYLKAPKNGEPRSLGVDEETLSILKQWRTVQKQ